VFTKGDDRQGGKADWGVNGCFLGGKEGTEKRFLTVAGEGVVSPLDLKRKKHKKGNQGKQSGLGTTE